MCLTCEKHLLFLCIYIYYTYKASVFHTPYQLEDNMSYIEQLIKNLDGETFENVLAWVATSPTLDIGKQRHRFLKTSIAKYFSGEIYGVQNLDFWACKNNEGLEELIKIEDDNDDTVIHFVLDFNTQTPLNQGGNVLFAVPRNTENKDDYGDIYSVSSLADRNPDLLNQIKLASSSFLNQLDEQKDDN